MIARRLRASLSLLAFALPLASCTSGKSIQPVRSVDPLEAMGMLRNDFAVAIDVRQPQAYAAGRIRGARLMPAGQAQDSDPAWQGLLKSLPRNKEALVYCDSTECASEVAEKLAHAGFKAANLGLYSEWLKAGLPTESTGSHGK